MFSLQKITAFTVLYSPNTIRLKCGYMSTPRYFLSPFIPSTEMNKVLRNFLSFLIFRKIHF